MCAIYFKHGDVLVEMVEQPYEAEEILQKLLADYPNLLSGDEDSVSKQWLLVEREIGIAAAEPHRTNRDSARREAGDLLVDLHLAPSPLPQPDWTRRTTVSRSSGWQADGEGSRPYGLPAPH